VDVIQDEQPARDRPQPVVGWASPVVDQTTPAITPIRCRWEYLLLGSDGRVVTSMSRGTEALGVALGMPLGSALQQAGDQEWELVTVHNATHGLTYVFKRPATGGA